MEMSCDKSAQELTRTKGTQSKVALRKLGPSSETVKSSQELATEERTQ